MVHYVDALPVGAEVGQYVIEAILGQGGFGIVYRARHPVYGRVALKEFFPKSQASRIAGGLIVPSTPRSEEAFLKGVERLLEEGAKLKGFKHKNIVQILDVFEDKNTAYLAMEEIDGSTLQVAVESKTLVPDKEMVEDFSEQMLDALTLVHSAGLIHRDVAPDNILVDKQGGRSRFVLIDFGGAKRVVTDVSEGSSRSLTKTGFSSPEQYGSESAGGIRATPASDIYGLAATLYWLISGKKPIDAPNRHVHDTLIKLSADSALTALYGRNFLSAVDHGLAMRVDARPATAEMFRKELREGFDQKSGGGSGSQSLKVALVALAAVVVIGVGARWLNPPQPAPPAPPAATADADASRAAQDDALRVVVSPPPTPVVVPPPPTPVVVPPPPTPVAAPLPVERAPVCHVEDRVERQCSTTIRTERQCKDQERSQRVSTSGGAPLGGMYPSQSAAESVCRAQIRSTVRSELADQCDGNLGNVNIICLCDYDASSPTGVSCDYEGSAQCMATREVCSNVSVPQEVCQNVNVPQRVCQ